MKVPAVSVVSIEKEKCIKDAISKYEAYKSTEIGFAGSVAYHFKEILLEVIEKHQLKLGRIIPTPINCV